MKKEDLKGKIEEYILKKLDGDTDYELNFVDPAKILNKKRLDSVAKYIYAKSRIKKVGKKWADFVYKENIRCLNNFSEKNNNKESFDDFKMSFNDLIVSIKTSGFRKEKSIISIGNDNSPLNGSHRLGTSLALNKKIHTIKFPINSFSFDYKYLKEKNHNEEALDSMALEYGKIKKDFHTAIVFPVAIEKIKEIEDILSDSGEIFYKKEILLSRNGIHNLVLQMYRDHEWNKKENTDFSSSLWHSYNRFVAGKSITIFFIESTNVEKMVKAKKEIRKLFNLGNFPIHISDDSEESIRISEQVLNRNSIHFLNNAIQRNNKNFQKLFNSFDSWINTNSCDKNNICIDGSSVLSVYGLRESKDLDFISSENIICSIKNIENHNNHLSQFLNNLDDLIHDPRNYFYFNGYKFLSLEVLKKMKKKRNELKDKIDIKLIDSVLTKKNIIQKNINKLKYSMLVANGYIVHFFRKKTPKLLFPIFKKTYKIIKKL